MTPLDSLFLIPLFVIGGTCAFTDIRYGKIKNKWIKAGLIWAALLYLSLIFYTIFYLHQKENIGYILEMLINGLIALGVGYFLWQFKLWSAGDAKLFTLFAFLIPLNFYSNYYLNYFPSFILLVNTFLLIILFLVIKALFSSIKNRPKKIGLIWRKWFELKKLTPKIVSSAKLYLNYLAFFIILRIIIQPISRAFAPKMGSNFALFFLILFIARRYLFGFLFKSKKIMPVLSILGGGYAIYLISQGQGVLLFSMLKMALIFMVTIGLLMRFLGQYIEKKEVKKTFSFAPFMLLASLITIIIKGSLLSFILSLFR